MPVWLDEYLGEGKTARGGAEGKQATYGTYPHRSQPRGSPLRFVARHALSFI